MAKGVQEKYPKGVNAQGTVGYEKAKRENKARDKKEEKLPQGKRFELCIWSLLESLGPLAISASPLLFKLKSGRKYQVDVFAEFHEVLICIECKDGKSHDIVADIRKIRAVEKGGLHSAIAKTRGGVTKFNKPVLHLLAYSKQVPTNQDYKDANAERVVIWDTRHVDFYRQLSDGLRESAREIIFSDLLKGQRFGLHEANEREVVALKMHHNGTPSYSMVLPPEDLKKMCYVNRRGLQYSSESGTHYQRTIKPGKIRKIREYIARGGSFPTSVLINFPRPLKVIKKLRLRAKGNAENVLVSLPILRGAAAVIDGQHRIFGYSGLPNQSKEHVLNVIAFGGLPEEEQVKMFVDINEQQTPVDAAVMCDLYTEIYPENNFDHCVSKTIKDLNTTGPLKGMVYIPSVSKMSRFGYSLYINNVAVVLSKSKSIYQDICNSKDTRKYTAIILAFLVQLAKNENIKKDIAAEKSFVASNNGLYVVLRTLSWFCDYVQPDFRNLNSQSKKDIIKKVKDFAKSIANGISEIGIPALIEEKRKSSESSKDDIAKKIVNEAAKNDPKMKRVAKTIYVHSVKEDLEHEFKEALTRGRDGAGNAGYFTEAILGTICAYINAGVNGQILVGINDDGKRVGINQEFKSVFNNNFDKLQRFVQDKYIEHLHVKGKFNKNKDIRIEIETEDPLIISITVNAAEKDSVAIIKISESNFAGYIKRTARKHRINMRDAEEEFGDIERAREYTSLYAEEMENLNRKIKS